MKEQSIRFYAERDGVPIPTAKKRRECAGLGRKVGKTWILTPCQWEIVKRTPIRLVKAKKEPV
jgi:hypothetical protein